ncbi:unnamed protein product [Ceutorhynchus assimilis]|uniref:Uncharacterized protein n=1 Tax=Ceutorhynchus assimilis TaxID=467358 RepID=A0A9N9QL12_9CUCU|nr:unnamed protein product [Ceutorhynchus assimilis]
MDYSSCPATRRRPRMGVSSLSRLSPPRVDRALPFCSTAAPRPQTPPRMPRTVPGLSRTPNNNDFNLDRTLSPGSADRTLTEHSSMRSKSATENVSLRSPEASKFEKTMEELTRLEFVEMQNVEDDLREFHAKRRKLIFSIRLLNGSKARKMVKKVANKMGF